MKNIAVIGMVLFLVWEGPLSISERKFEQMDSATSLYSISCPDIWPWNFILGCPRPKG